VLGGALLCAPVFRDDGAVEVYLPPGRWTPLLGGEEVAGGGWRRERHGVLSLPLYVREGTLLALGAVDDRPDYDHADGVELHLFALADGGEARATVRDLRGVPALRAVVRRAGDRLSIELEGNTRGCAVVLRGVDAIAEPPPGVDARPTPTGVRIVLASGRAQAELALRGGGRG
jgi:alpha-D-xyloside xylohydrolase